MMRVKRIESRLREREGVIGCAHEEGLCKGIVNITKTGLKSRCGMYIR